MATKNPAPEAQATADEFAAEREAALAEGKVVIDIPAGPSNGPALRVDN